MRPSKLQHYQDQTKYWEESWRLEETCCHSDSSGKLSANAGVKNYQMGKIITMLCVCMHIYTYTYEFFCMYVCSLEEIHQFNRFSFINTYHGEELICLSSIDYETKQLHLELLNLTCLFIGSNRGFYLQTLWQFMGKNGSLKEGDSLKININHWKVRFLQVVSNLTWAKFYNSKRKTWLTISMIIYF